ncbi:hypothetical protein LTR36_000530 [Oleoguttula mirabilis]|uniref:Uncharacterized protein n=1 Tax=Oleoguttula mirabilis TaxID=1507867 RepID=A0AAV9JQS8_9PEZI|nr:hypothetical protein LTR36_000530 [Oleoguttula mirabilis]
MTTNTLPRCYTSQASHAHQPSPPPPSTPAPVSGYQNATQRAPFNPHDPAYIAQRQAKNWPPSDAGIKYLFFGSLVVAPVVTYAYYQYRKEHMDRVRLQMLREAQERYRVGGAR